MIADTELLLPGLAASEVVDDAQRDALLGFSLAQIMKVTLYDLDPRIKLAFAKPGGDSNTRILDPGYWYFIRFSDHGEPAYWKLTENGELDGGRGEGYSHPEYAHIEALQKRDAWKHPRVWAEFEKRRRDAKRAGEQASEELHREFREKLDERIRHLYEVQIAVTPGMKRRLDGENVSQHGLILPSGVPGEAVLPDSAPEGEPTASPGADCAGEPVGARENWTDDEAAAA